MARETVAMLKERIAQLENINQLQMNQIQQLNNERENILDKANVISMNEYNGLLSDMEMYQNSSKIYENLYNKSEIKNKKLNETIQELISEDNQVQKIKNERGAGRKTIISDELSNNVRKLRLDGETFQNISDKLKISVGLAHKINKSIDFEETKKLTTQIGDKNN